MKKLFFVCGAVAAFAIFMPELFAFLCMGLFWLGLAGCVVLYVLCKYSPGPRPAFGSITRVKMRQGAQAHTAQTLASEVNAATPDSTSDQVPTGAAEAIKLYAAAIWMEQQQEGGQTDLRLHFAGALISAARASFAAGRFDDALKYATMAAAARVRQLPVPEDFIPHQATLITS